MKLSMAEMYELVARVVFLLAELFSITSVYVWSRRPIIDFF